jgi:hypothetical protein
MKALHLLVAAILIAGASVSAATEPRQGAAAEQAARTLIRTEIDPATFDELYVQASRAAVQNLEAAVQPSLQRALTDDERKRLSLFWQRKMRELLPYSAIEDRLVPRVTKQLSLEELQEINRFNGSPVGRKLAEVQAVISFEARASGEQMGKRLADKDWQAKVDEELKREFPLWFPTPGPGK